MYKHLLLIALIFVLSGCSYKNTPLSLTPYDGFYTGPRNAQAKTIFVRRIMDLRPHKEEIGHWVENGAPAQKLYTHSSFEQLYTQGFYDALRAAGFETDTTSKRAHMVVEIYLKEVQIIHSDRRFESNLKGEMALEVLVRKGDEVTTLTFRPKEEKLIFPTHEAKDLEPFLYGLFKESIDQITARLTRF